MIKIYIFILIFPFSFFFFSFGHLNQSRSKSLHYPPTTTNENLPAASSKYPSTVNLPASFLFSPPPCHQLTFENVDGRTTSVTRTSPPFFSHSLFSFLLFFHSSLKSTISQNLLIVKYLSIRLLSRSTFFGIFIDIIIKFSYRKSIYTDTLISSPFSLVY